MGGGSHTDKHTSERLALTVHVLEDVENGKNLPVIGHQSLAHHVVRHHQVLQDLQGGAHHLAVPRVQGVWRTHQIKSNQIKSDAFVVINMAKFGALLHLVLLYKYKNNIKQYKYIQFTKIPKHIL